MYQEAIAKTKLSIFPIFIVFQKDGRTGLGVAGTGFFINNEGHFITAHHVVSEAPAGSRLLYGGNIPHRRLNKSIPIQEVHSDAVKDVFLGQVVEDYLPGLKLTTDKAEPGKSVCLCGYPLAKLAQNTDGSINVNNVRQYWQPTFVIDGITANINNKQYKGFITQHTSLKGMSGGPVFDMNGHICGMDVATMSRKIPEPNGADMIIPNGVAIDIATIKEVLEGRVTIIE